jgi:hydroxymethylpyrimidine pyrophosphatase-like HAD family hydrolase
VNENILDSEIADRLRTFLDASKFSQLGGVVTDLDGTAVHEQQGRIYIPQAVELGLKEIYEMGRPIVLNSLRFPLSVLKTFGVHWYRISNAPIPCVTLNGSLLGYVNKDDDGRLSFQEIKAIPLDPDEIDAAVDKIQ